MKQLVVGAAIAGAVVLGLRAAARRGQQMCAEHCGSSAKSQHCG